MVLARLRNVHDQRMRLGIHELQAPGVRHIRRGHHAIPNDGVLPVGIGNEEVAFAIVDVDPLVVVAAVVDDVPPTIVADRIGEIAISDHVLRRFHGQQSAIANVPDIGTALRSDPRNDQRPPARV